MNVNFSDVDVRKIEDMYDRDMSEISAFEKAMYIACRDETLPDFLGGISKYFDNPDAVSMEIFDVGADNTPTVNTYTITVANSTTLTRFFNEYNANMDKLICAIIGIDLDFFRTIDGDFEIVVFASIDNDSMADIIDRMSKDISINEHNEFMPYEIRVSRTGNQISITPINNFVIEYK